MQTTLAPQKQMQFAPVPNNDGDELSQAIESDATNHDDQWDLKDEIDAAQLNTFLDDALTTIGAEDPEEQYSNNAL